MAIERAESKQSIKMPLWTQLAMQDACEYGDTIAELVHEPLLVLDDNLRVILANRSFCQAFTVESGEVKGGFFFEINNCQWDIPSLRELLEEKLPLEDVINDFEVELDFKDLGHRLLVLNARQIRRHTDGASIILLAMEDITEGKSAELARNISKEYFHSLIENAQDVFIILHGDTTIRYKSSSYGRILGYEPEEEIGKSWFEYVHQHDMPRAARSFAQLVQNPGSTVHDEVRVRHKDDSWHTIEVVGNNLLCDPIVKGIVVNFRDITESKGAEAELAKYHHHLQELVEERTAELSNANDLLVQEIRERKRAEEELRIKDSAITSSINAIAIGNLEGKVKYVNNSFVKLWGYDNDREILGKNAADFWQDKQKVDDMIAAILQKGSWQGESVALRKDGSIFDAYLLSSVVRSDGDKPICLMMSSIDITERKKTEETLQELYKQERDLRQRREAEIERRVEFTRALTHELKTPLTSVLASSELLVSELQDETPLRLAKSINRSASNLNNRIDELLDLTKSEIGMLQLKLEPVDLLKLVREVVDELASIASSNRQFLILEIPPDLSLVRADIIRLEQIITNLLGNAIKFTPEGGKITLRVREEETSVLIEVEDTGPGISEEEQRQLFEPYRRLETDKGRLSGLGLGLSLCKTLVELHGGQIWVASQLGKGSKFTLSLPLDRYTHQEAPLENENKLWKILVIEDDPEIVESISVACALRLSEARLMSTRLGREGIRLAETESPDIIILDLGLPDINGFEILKEIRRFSSVPVIILTVRASEADVVRGLNWGADDYVVKPFKQQELLGRLRGQLRKHALTDEEEPIIYGPLRFDPSTLQLIYNGKDMRLTVIEGRIVQCLMKHGGRVVSYSRLAEAVWGNDYPGSVESLRVHIRRLRGKLEIDPSNPLIILNQANRGYSIGKPN